MAREEAIFVEGRVVEDSDAASFLACPATEMGRSYLAGDAVHASPREAE